MRVHFSVFGVGVGHATRALTVARELARRGHTTSFAASDEAADFLRRWGYPVARLPLLKVGWGADGGLSIKRTTRNVLGSPGPFARQILGELEAMKGADIVISDSKLSPVIAARLASKPCLLITNQLMLTIPPSARRMRVSWLEWAAGFLSSTAWSLSSRVVVPDLPPPHSISYLNVAHPLGARVSTFIGPLLDFDAVREERIEEVRRRLDIDGSRPLVFIQATGNPRSRSSLIELALQAAPELGERYQLVLAEGNPLGSERPERTSWGWRMEWCPYPETLMALSAAVVSRAGHSTISRALAVGRPLVLLPIRNHSEQLGNANQVERLGVGKSLGEGAVTPRILKEAIDAVVGDDRYRLNAERMAERIKRIDPLGRLVGILEELAAR